MPWTLNGPQISTGLSNKHVSSKKLFRVKYPSQIVLVFFNLSTFFSSGQFYMCFERKKMGKTMFNII